MTTKTLTATAIALLFLSCNFSPRPNHPDENISEVLDSPTSSYDVVKKRGYEDLIESLYSELVAKNPDLKSIEGKIDSLNKSQGDSTYRVLQFDNKNQYYFNAANTHSSNIKDSMLRGKITTLITNSLSAYNAKISKHTSLLHAINTNNSTIADLHLALKIVKTLPVIQKYQNDHLPETKPLAGFADQQNQLIKLADTIIKK